MSNNSNSNNCSGGSSGSTSGAGGGGGGSFTIPATPGQVYTFTLGGSTAGGWTTMVPQPVAVVPEAKKNKDGCNCKKCKEHYPYAEPNQDDGTLICYRCRQGY